VIYGFAERRRSPAIWPPARALDRRAVSTLDAIFCPSELDRPRLDRTTAGRGGDGATLELRRVTRPGMDARESVYRRSTARVGAMDGVQAARALGLACRLSVALVALPTDRPPATCPVQTTITFTYCLLCVSF